MFCKRTSLWKQLYKKFFQFQFIETLFNLGNVEFDIYTVLISSAIKYDEYVSGN